MIQIGLKVTGLNKVREHLAKLSGPAFKKSISDALNDVAFDVRKKYQDEMGTVFDRPTPYILRSVRVSMARPDHMIATVGPTRTLGKGVDPANVLAAEIAGGKRRDKRSEVALRRAGILPTGYATAIPANPFPGSEDAFGNLKGSFITTLLSYFNAFGEQGYRANMTAAKRRKLAARSTTAGGYKTIGGYELFVSYGRLRGGKTAHLAPGIWARSGIHGSTVRPVLMFVSTPSYTRRLDMSKIGNRAAMQAMFERKLRYRIRAAVGV